MLFVEEVCSGSLVVELRVVTVMCNPVRYFIL